MAADRTGRVLEEVRRALGRLAGRVSTHSLPEARSGIAVTVRRPETLQFAPPPPGARQGEWQSSAQVWRLAAPVASAGGDGVDPSTVVTVIGANVALRADTSVTAEVPCRFVQVPTHAWTPKHDAPGVAAVLGVPVLLDATAPRRAEMTFEHAVARVVQLVPSAPPRPTSDRTARWQVTTRGVKAGLAPILRVPMMRRRLPGPPGGESFAPERRLLAAAAEAPEADVVLIGIFPHVPLGAVERLAVIPDGAALQAWVRPGTVGRGAGTVTVILGRQRSTGRMLQAVSRGIGQS